MKIESKYKIDYPAFNQNGNIKLGLIRSEVNLRDVSALYSRGYVMLDDYRTFVKPFIDSEGKIFYSVLTHKLSKIYPYKEDDLVPQVVKDYLAEQKQKEQENEQG